MLLVTVSVIFAAYLRENPAPASATPAVPAAEPTTTPTPAPLATLSQDDPHLGMNVLVGAPLGDALTSSVQVLPGGNVAGMAADTTEAVVVSPPTSTRWVKSAEDTTLWSGPDAGASAFTDVPADSFFRVTGPETADRMQVYYVGDGLLRMAGDGWVDVEAVVSIDAPAPGQVPAVDADASAPLPTWVQTDRAATFWSGPDDNAVQLTDLPQWSYLRVAGVEHGGRLLVNYAGDYASRQPGVGWVDEASVGPAGDPGVWVTNHRATSLWSGTDPGAIKFNDLPQWTKLRIVDGAPSDPSRLEVEFFGDGRARVPGVAWIAVSDIGPITPPAPLPAGAITSNAQHQTFGTPTDFIAAVGAAAQTSEKATGVPASVTVAQAILESDWGRSRLARQGNNLFGIKALGAPGPDGIVTMATWEHTPSGDVVVQAPFKAYVSLNQSIDDHGKFFVSNRRYAAALAVGSDARAFAQAIQNAGYATDPNYATKLVGLMDKYNLYRFDT